jgi:transcriptional regulator with XRE-family HTH domain
MNDFYLIYRQAGFFQKTLADYLGVTSKTVRNWEKTNKPPIAVIKLLQLIANDLSHLGNDWAGFRFIAGELVTPENEFVSPGKVRAHKYLQMTIDFRVEENTRLKLEIERLKSPKAYFPQRKVFPS